MKVSCSIRLCRTDKLVTNGLVEWNEKKNCPPKNSLMRVWICPYCKRERHEFFTSEEKIEWRRSHVA